MLIADLAHSARIAGQPTFPAACPAHYLAPAKREDAIPQMYSSESTGGAAPERGGGSQHLEQALGGGRRGGPDEPNLPNTLV